MTKGRLARTRPELLARLLEGDLAEWERSNLIAELAEDPESIGVLLDAEAALREVGGMALVRESPQRPKRTALVAMASLAVATAAALLVVGPFGGSAGPVGPGFEVEGPAELFAGSVTGPLPDAWHVAGLPVQRGDQVASEEALAIRLGALTTALAVAVRQSDETATAETAQAIRRSLEAVGGTGPTRALMVQLESSIESGSVSDESVAEVVRGLMARFPRPSFAAGQVAEHARLVSLSGGTPTPPEWLTADSRGGSMLLDLRALFGLEGGREVGDAGDFREFLTRYATSSAWDH